MILHSFDKGGEMEWINIYMLEIEAKKSIPYQNLKLDGDQRKRILERVIDKAEFRFIRRG